MREIAGVRIPDSKLAVAALDLVKIESHASIYKHVLRTFVFGGLAARAKGIGFDEELFFLGAVLHDLGLTERFGAPAGRFEVVGADAAEKFLSAKASRRSGARLFGRRSRCIPQTGSLSAAPPKSHWSISGRPSM